MVFRKTLLAVLALGLLLQSPPARGQASLVAPAPAPATGPDSLSAQPVSPVVAIRATYENAWALRQAADYPEAIALADTALRQVSDLLATGPDMTTRRDLYELQSRLSGLRDAARKDQQSAATARATGNEADEKVLSAPAIEGIEAQSNADVTKWIEFFTGAGRSTFERWLKRSGRYVNLFRSVLQREGLPPDLVHLVFVESGFNLNARSTSAAVGPWQFLKGTGRLFGLTVDNWLDERKDPEKSTVAAARYLKHLYSIFGDWPLAIASYNAGEGTVLRAIKAQGTTNYWDLRLPRQTEEYVPQFMAVLEISRDPEKYGFDDVALDDPMAFDEVALKGAVDLRALAKLAECDVDELRELNPAVLRHATPGAGGLTSLRVPRGKGEILLKRLQSGAELPAVDLTLRHRVKRRETLQKIAAQYNVSARQLALANGIGKKRPLRRGMVLTVPVSLRPPTPAILDASDPRASTAYVPARRITPRRMVDARSTADGRRTVTVKRGETLSTIAARYQVSTDDIKKWNRLKTSRLHRGQRLKIRTEQDAVSDSAQLAKNEKPEPKTEAKDTKESKETKEEAQLAKNDDEEKTKPTLATTKPGKTSVQAKKKSARSKHLAAAKPRPRVIVVRRGDTLSQIAKRHGVSVTELRRANNMTGPRLQAGQRLRLPA